ncbi:MAG: class I SAM-dependent methyltransferase, partial [Pseudonocardia sp.]|nr:class I SAM-dependent methyltransferase [Pseudonocardia sp.]
YPQGIDVQHAADAIARLCPEGGRVLELGIGHGRLALPLADRGVRVHGVDASPGMLAWLRERDPDGRVSAEEGDFTSTVAGKDFAVVAIIMNTFFAVTSVEGQIECLHRMAEQVAPGGAVVIEAFDPTGYHGQTETRNEIVHIPDGLMVNTTEVDPARQLMIVVRTLLTGGEITKTREIVRYCWPCELDLMARVAGLELVSRSSGWNGEPFVVGSHRHVSVYRRADTAAR